MIIFEYSVPNTLYSFIPSQTYVLPIFCLIPPLLCLLSRAPNLPFYSYFCLKSSTSIPKQVKRQFDENPELLIKGSTARPDYEKCVEISTRSSLKEMIAPGALVLLAPLITGTFFGVTAVYGLLTGSLLSSVQLAISMSNTGGAWDNCKKYIESGVDPSLGGKGGEIHKAAVVGDTVGDPLKDTSGPALNIVMKLMAIVSLVFADFFFAINGGQGLFNMALN